MKKRKIQKEIIKQRHTEIEIIKKKHHKDIGKEKEVWIDSQKECKFCCV